MTTEERLKELKEMLGQVQTRDEFDYVMEQIVEMETMLVYEEHIRAEEKREAN